MGTEKGPAEPETWSALLEKDRALRALARGAQELETKAARYKRCGAKTHAPDGHPCRSVAIRPNGRCYMYGATATGPRTPEGKARWAAGQRARWARRVMSRQGWAFG